MELRTIDDLTELDRRIIVALQQNGRASWTSIAEIIGSSVPTVTRRGQQLITDGVVKITVLPTPTSFGQVDMFVVRINCTPGTQLKVAAELVSRPDVRFLSLVTGKYDIVAEIMVRGGASHYPDLISPVQSIAGIERWRSDLLLHVYKVGHDWSRQLLAERLAVLERVEDDTETDTDDQPPASTPAICSPDHFDDVDWQILATLKQDGRTTFKAIGADLGLNESSVRRRFERMRQNRCVDVLTLVPAAALGMGAETLLIVKVRPGHLDGVVRGLVPHSAVRYLAATLDQNSLFCEVIAGSNDDLYRFITETLSHLDGVEGWEASMELLNPKRGFAETPWWRTQVT
ncbi:Lrp/AsnC family transcriptional regulator [Microlunatus speluncae]|uniref:Lrp/AsnC family transcriptional regulator n=1 Tax=Microlunatus speluncae TaxID=2594267 RepID=UPI001C2DDD1A|nr:Lrp/AsnC family transcriptional regulator [Microlunatus speluncae]